MKKIEIKSIGFDSFDREVFQTKSGNILCDVNLDYSHEKMNLHYKYLNQFEGEPFFPMLCQYVVVEQFTTEDKYYGDDDGRTE